MDPSFTSHRDNADPFAPLLANNKELSDENEKLKLSVNIDRRRAVNVFFCWVVSLVGVAGALYAVWWYNAHGTAYGVTARANAERAALAYFRQEGTAVTNVYCADGLTKLCSNMSDFYVCESRDNTPQTLPAGPVSVCCDSDPARFNDGCRRP